MIFFPSDAAEEIGGVFFSATDLNVKVREFGMSGDYYREGKLWKRNVWFSFGDPIGM